MQFNVSGSWKHYNEKGFFKICQGHHMWFKSEQSIFCRFVQFTCNSAPARVYKVISNILISCWFWLQLLVIIALLVAIRVPQEQPFWKQSKFCLKVRLTFTRNGVICSKILVLQNSLTNLPNFVINDCGWKKLEGFKRKNRWLLICKYYLLPRMYHVSLR